MLLLALDTSGPTVSVALHDGSAMLASGAEGGRRHAEVLAPLVAAALLEIGASAGDLTRIAVGTGPGPFTGLRTGLVSARVMGAALAVPVHGVCSLDALAADAAPRAGGRSVLVVTDARRREVYWARYAADATASGTRTDGPGVSRPDQVAVHGAVVVGSGVALYPDAFGSGEIEPEPAVAPALARLVAARLATGGELTGPDPLYLRRPDAAEPGPAKSVS